MLTSVPPAVAVLQVADGRILESTGQAESWLVPPGSTVKPLVIAELLRLGRLNDRDTYLCRGKNRIAGRDFTCSHPTGLPPLDAAQIIAYSCNGGIAHFSQRLSSSELQTAFRNAGFRVAAADTTLQALGEAGVWVTPMQLAAAYRRIAQADNKMVLDGLAGAVEFGTAQAAAVDGISVLGKTGSSTAASGLHAALFVGFAPRESPDIVVAIALQGHSGGSDAAPVAAKRFKKYVNVGQTHYRVKTAGRVVLVEAEDYVAGVLAGESAVFSHLEALKAMAIAARTFAVHEQGRHNSDGFDFCDTTHCQRYISVAVTERLRESVRATQGKLLRYGGRTAFTPYTRSCGGMSEASSNVWPAITLPYLKIHDDPFCEVRYWNAHVDAHNVRNALQIAGFHLPSELHSMRVIRRTSSGRVAQVELTDDRPMEIDGNAFRFAIGRSCGWNLLRSDWFDVAEGFDFHGRGEGHGVGLCQQGAEAMAAIGHTHREILAFYYPGTSTIPWNDITETGFTVYAAQPEESRVILGEALAEARTLPWPPAFKIEIYVYPDLDSFRSETGQPGWIAAQSQNSKICLQPLGSLRKYGIVAATIRHELLHVVVEQRAVAAVPIWFREGIVEYLSGDQRGGARIPFDLDLTQRQHRTQAEAAYEEAAAEVQQLVMNYGRSEVLGWLAKGLPAAVMNSSAKRLVTNKR